MSSPSLLTGRKRERDDDDTTVPPLSPDSKLFKLEHDVEFIYTKLRYHNARLHNLEHPPPPSLSPRSSRTEDENPANDDLTSSRETTETETETAPPSSPTSTLYDEPPNTKQQKVTKEPVLKYGGDSPYFPYLEEPSACDDNDSALTDQNYISKPQVYSRVAFYSGDNHCHSILCRGLLVKTWHTCMTDCIHYLIDTKERITQIDWYKFGQRFMTRIKDDNEYLEAYDRLRKMFSQRFPGYYNQYMGDLPSDAHLRAIRIRYSVKNLTKVAYDDITWWKNIVWKDVLDELEYMERHNIKHWLQAYSALLTAISKIDGESKFDKDGQPITFPCTYHSLEIEYAHKMFHKPPPFVDGCPHCRQDQEQYERNKIYNL